MQSKSNASSANHIGSTNPVPGDHRPNITITVDLTAFSAQRLSALLDSRPPSPRPGILWPVPTLLRTKVVYFQLDTDLDGKICHL